MAKQYDIVVYGATSFVGEILCAYLAQHRETPAISWAIAGRSQARLEDTKAKLNLKEQNILIADASDEAALREICSQTKVLITTVGPYALYGETVLKVCAETGTDYCDLTGEAQFIRRMLDRHEKTAQQSGARIVNCCGFDSIPSDLGVYYTQQHSLKTFNAPCEEIHMRVKAAKGGFSGGTYASLLNVVEEGAKDPVLRKQMSDPYLLCPPEQPRHRQHNNGLAEYDTARNTWDAPFVMAAINTRVVQRSSSLLSPLYGDGFRYDEAMQMGSGLGGRLKALAMGGGLAGFMITASNRPGRWLLKKVLPAPGEGPSPEEQRNGFYDLRFFGRTAKGDSLTCKVTGDRDPGYGSTAKMLGQAAICLARDISHEDKPGGFWTPASCLGDTLITRLRDYAGLNFASVD
jgi:short subunit dehydrogenase-like uncharacterized protein